MRGRWYPLVTVERQIREQRERESLGENIENFEKLFNVKTILEHHLAFAEECTGKGIYPLGLKTCVAYRANDTLRKKWKAVLNNTSIELLALCRDHFRSTLAENTNQIEEIEIEEIEKKMESLKEEKNKREWEEKKETVEREMNRREKEMKNVRDRKLKHAAKVHTEGKIFLDLSRGVPIRKRERIQSK